ncbi:hypothetical protein PF005_g14634 [Phytophthora fragariae]|uniref:Uncharacterized protein n=1 Tax=Phytophthora fragariae TaxID=53985 RepID=A0A6A3TLB0_9STRA|nr:hypothetical protein PF003_g33055 [Phytophthora fragariae]KAE8933987.1 hypothetical protein PF009_g16022 [Phytophthora fragariae]KAE9001783.1 hypothetical protein PF011_g13595 [Phytophthora fragariae]KAE9099348.1 hypothetical protein PF010_g15230 [Phytophthora fragariae]KAE9101303.1 hypothetical protein PF007_g15189 [Phytophthora fragariae]
MRRDLSRERVFFLLVLAAGLLVLSGLMLRHESAVLPARTFRDGFTVAEGVVRRAEIVAAANASDGNATMAPPEAEGHTTTIKTEDGDEITIKRSATSKGNKITTISRDDKGKLTIEDATAEERRTEAETKPEEAPRAEKQDTFEDIPTASPSAILKQDTGTARRDTEEVAADAAEDEATGAEAVVVSGGKKVTVVQVNRSLTKVSLSDVEEEDHEDATR